MQNSGIAQVDLRWGDRVILVLAVLLILFLYWHFWQQAGLGNQAAIHVNGKFLQYVDLYSKQQIEVQGKLGISTLQVENGKIRFIDSPCTGKQCVHQGWLHDAGEFAACLPNEISVRLVGADPRYDSVNF